MAFADTKFEDVTEEVWQSVAKLADEGEELKGSSKKSLDEMEMQRNEAVERALAAEKELKEQKQKYVDAFFSSAKEPEAQEQEVDEKPEVSYPTTMEDIDKLFEKGN